MDERERKQRFDAETRALEMLEALDPDPDDLKPSLDRYFSGLNLNGRHGYMLKREQKWNGSVGYSRTPYCPDPDCEIVVEVSFWNVRWEEGFDIPPEKVNLFPMFPLFNSSRMPYYRSTGFRVIRLEPRS